MNSHLADARARRLRWPWVVLGLGLVWTALIRVPLVLNAADHIDSDLAVDGLTLRDAAIGHWRWHYPGTPHMGILPMLASFPQALIWGAGPITLVSGGTIIWLLMVVATFWLAARGYGLDVAGWAIMPLVFSSMGTIWLSGRITGGHLLTLAWHTAALAGLCACLTRGRWPGAAALGLWCGVGLYLDGMFVFTLAGMVAAAFLAWLSGGRSRAGIGLLPAFVIAMLIGLVPREIGRRIDPYDAYPAQFAATLEPWAMTEHLRLFAFHCLPRLIGGAALVQTERVGADIPAALAIGLDGPGAARLRSTLPGKEEWLAIVLMTAFLIALFRLARDPSMTTDPARKAASRATLTSAALIVAAFLVNRNVYNSDNYRYLVFLLTPWALGFGLLMSDVARRGWAGRIAMWIAVAALCEAMSSAALLWYRDERGYVDRRGMPVCVPGTEWSELTILPDVARGAPPGSTVFVVPPDVTHVFGGYWDVYKMAFLSGGRLTGIPFPIYPNRFRGWSRGLGAGRGKLLVLSPEMVVRKRAATASAEELGTGVVHSARRLNWRKAFGTLWISEGRDPAELDRIEVVVP